MSPTLWFRRRRDVEESVEETRVPAAVEVTREIAVPGGVLEVEAGPDAPAVARAIVTELRRDRPIVGDGPLADPDVVDEVDAHADDVIALLRERDELREKVEQANARADRAGRLADQTARGAAAAVRFYKLDAAQADEAAQQLRRALEEQRPAPDPHQLGIHLMRVWTRPRPPAVPPEVRWRETAEAAIDAVRVRWPIEAYPLTPAEMGAVAPETSPGGGAEVAGPLPAAAPPAPGDSTETGPLSVSEIAELHEIADERLRVDPADTSKVGDKLGFDWLRVQPPFCRTVRDGHPAAYCTRHDGHRGQHVVTVGGRVLAVWPAETSPGGGMVAEAPDALTAPGAPAPGDTPQTSSGGGVSRPPAPGDPTPDPAGPRVSDLQRYARSIGGRLEVEVTVPGDREQLIAQVLVDHEQLSDGTCRCRWAGWPDSTGWPMWHAEHVAQQLRAAGVLA